MPSDSTTERTEARRWDGHECQVCGLSTGRLRKTDIGLYGSAAAGRIRLCRSATGAPSRPGIADASTPGPDRSGAGSFLFQFAPQASVPCDTLILSPLFFRPLSLSLSGLCGKPQTVCADPAHTLDRSGATGRFPPDRLAGLYPTSSDPSPPPGRSSCPL